MFDCKVQCSINKSLRVGYDGDTAVRWLASIWSHGKLVVSGPSHPLHSPALRSSSSSRDRSNVHGRSTGAVDVRGRRCSEPTLVAGLALAVMGPSDVRSAVLPSARQWPGLPWCCTAEGILQDLFPKKVTVISCSWSIRRAAWPGWTRR